MACRTTSNRRQRIHVNGVIGRGERKAQGNKKKLTLFVFELDDTADRPEDFLLYDVHIGCRVGEYGRLNEVSFGAVTFSAKMDRSALGLAYINEVHHALGDTHEIAKERKERTTKSMEHTHQIVS